MGNRSIIAQRNVNLGTQNKYNIQWLIWLCLLKEQPPMNVLIFP